MDSQLTSPNMPTPAERPAGVTPEDLKAGGALGPEVAPTPGAAPAAANAGAPVASKLTAADVAAAIAATPVPGVPPTAAPSVAGDVDVIEPEWVDKAEEVVRAHSGDPYGEEEAIEELQEDYLQKRYGINVADPNAGNTKPKGA